VRPGERSTIALVALGVVAVTIAFVITDMLSPLAAMGVFLLGALAVMLVVARMVEARETVEGAQRDLLHERVTRLQELTSVLSTARTPTEVVETAVSSLQRAVDATATSFCRLEGDMVDVIGSVGYDDELMREWTAFPLSTPVAISDAIRLGEPVVCRTRQEILDRYPAMANGIDLGGSRAVAAVPLRGESAVFGAIGMSFADPRPFEIDEVSFLVAAATQVATAYERARAFGAEREARHAAERANGHLTYLVEATAVLSQSLDPETTMQRLAELAVPTLADWCAVHVVEGEYAHPVAVAGREASATAMVRDLSQRHPIPLDAPAGLGAVARTGEPIIMRRVTMDAVRASTDAAELVDLLSRLRSIAIMPMSYRGRVVGTVTLSNTTDRDLTDAEVDLARELAARAAQAITNARLYTERTRVAQTLQASLMPPSPTIIPGIDVATRFVAAAEGLDVGGDFYDVFRLGTIENPSPTWALVIGDVRGKGADAAAITGIARATIRATALDEMSPARMLERLNQVLLAAAQDDRFATETGEPRFCTVCVVTVTPLQGGAELVVAVGGHPLPYIIRADGALDQAGRAGGLIGVMPDPGITDVPHRLHPGDSLVLFTDGVTERHAAGRFFDEDGLTTVLAESAGLDADDVAGRVELASRTFVATEPRDDLAILVARVPQVAAGAVARLELPQSEKAPSLARRFVADALTALGAVEQLDVAELLASELVTNALLHGAPTVSVEVLAVPGGIRVAVQDAHPDLPSKRTAAREDEHGRGLLLVEMLARAWGVDARPPGKSVWFELSV
jgi:serine phosphatase RsbU (regulator of sigma subunit)/anti-sigma regulatory factor (Ser/Thr protein kinase)